MSSADGDQPVMNSAAIARLTAVGTMLAVLAVVADAVALARYPVITGASRGYPLASLVCSALMVLICGFQFVCWRRRSASLKRPSWVAHLVSYLVVLVAMWMSIASAYYADSAALTSLLLFIGLVLVLAAQLSGAVQYWREDGPPGTLPAHGRALMARIERSRHADDDDE